MDTRLARTIARTIARTAATAVAAVATTGAVLVPAGVASADPVTEPAPSACRPANTHGVVQPAPSSAGHRHYAVVLTAAPGTANCILQGSPSDLAFSLNGSPRAVDAVPYGDQTDPVVFGPADPVQFDIQVPSSAGPAQADEVDLSVNGAGGQIPGTFTAYGPLAVDAGIQVGPVTEH
jgi:hypothetical protein